jgi:RNA polymerase sigma-54 factor
MLKAGLTLVQRPEQRLVMTQRLRQAIEVMAMARLDLEQHVALELEENILLDADADVTADAEPEEDGAEADSSDLEMKEQPESEPEIRWEDYLDDSMPAYGDESTSDEEEDDDRRADFVQEVSFHDYLEQQLGLLRLPDSDREVATVILGSLDDAGFLAVSVEDIADDTGRTPEEVAEILRFVQTRLEPQGVGARDRREFFLLQLEAAEERNELLLAIVRHHFDDLLANRLPRIAKNLRESGAADVSVEDVQQAKQALAGLKLEPAQGFLEGFHGIFKFRTDARPIVPDVVVEQVDGEYRVRSLDDSIPKLRLNRHYLRLLQNGTGLTPDVREYLENYRRKAKDLIESIHERGKTIESVAREIFRVQREWLEHGDTHLKPLVQREIAARLDKSESTISRATKGKYVQTPRGIYELKEFFSSGLEQDTGEMASSKSVKIVIQDIVAREDGGAPLSDDAISELLAEAGYHVRRRTVAKYRAELGIAPSHQRKNKW